MRSKSCAAMLAELHELEDLAESPQDDLHFFTQAYGLALEATQADDSSLEAWRLVAHYALMLGLLECQQRFFDSALRAADQMRAHGAEKKNSEAAAIDVLVHASSFSWFSEWSNEVKAAERVAACHFVWADLTAGCWGFIGERIPRARRIEADSGAQQTRPRITVIELGRLRNSQIRGTG